MHIRPSLLLLACFLMLVCAPAVRGEVFVTKDGAVYVGDAVGRTAETMLIKTPDGHVSLKVSDLVELPPAVLEAKGAVHEAQRYDALAARAVAGKQPAVAVSYWQSALDELATVPPEAGEEFKQANDLAAQFHDKLRVTAKELDERGLAAFQGRTFSKKVLAYHLNAGHELIGRRFWIEPPQRCTECAGTGRLPCVTCERTGVVRRDCPYCRAGSIDCPYCHGTGSRPCPSCLGSGQISRACRACAGAGDVVCDDCDGTGTKLIRCPECDGKGRIVLQRRWIRIKGGYLVRDDVTQVCPRCDGVRKVRVACATCDGTGRTMCLYCNGTGRRVSPCTTCRGRGTVFCPTILTCRHCRGVGWIATACPDCLGKGYVDCPACEGRGFTGDPQPDPPTEKAETPKAKE
jgi:DnaJ-class molecular chaperone